VADVTKYRESLQAMPVPEPRAGFVDRVMARATGRRRRIGNPWWAAVGGAIAASTVWAILWVMQPRVTEPTRVVLALNESRDVPLVIDSERDLEGATIRLYVSGSVALSGYEEQNEIEWATTLTRGANLLSLPVVAREPGDGLVVAEIEHEGRKRRVTVAMHVSKDDIA
jgi:hypothetical protein